MTYTHQPLNQRCGGFIKFVTRTVSAQPDDADWPCDFERLVPYCEVCRIVVNANHIIERAERAQEAAK